MSTTLTIDATGGAFIPPTLLNILGLKPGATLLADVGPKGISLKPAEEETEVEGILAADDLANGLRVIKKGRRLVITGGEPFSAVEVIQAAREERDEMLRANCDCQN